MMTPRITRLNSSAKGNDGSPTVQDESAHYSLEDVRTSNQPVATSTPGPSRTKNLRLPGNKVNRPMELPIRGGSRAMTIKNPSEMMMWMKMISKGAYNYLYDTQAACKQYKARAEQAELSLDRWRESQAKNTGWGTKRLKLKLRIAQLFNKIHQSDIALLELEIDSLQRENRALMMEAASIKRRAKLPDVPKLTDGKGVAFDYWRILIRQELFINADFYPTETRRMALIISHCAGDAAAYICPRLDKDALNPYRTADEIMDHLATLFYERLRAA
ncbi:hypothetical protein N7494_004790 [Penicillium frequentans]|uniref:Uncharacterized protein n=1 Tax=Penicillium frequentans TaxID=3151616 RepID=A0AAD6D1B7_9EURO|nr:hypothetical protein N7494_004790 [Penicillium glabrum]